ncbi:MAG: transporter [Legionellales bacterium]|nr:transporter [Legionellales bacterium]OUX66152.1 MAG: transporter [Gammaproteobacteria bacterium TMED281]
MIKAFWLQKKHLLWSWGGLILLIISIWMQVQMDVALNMWNGRFYDLLQNALSYQNSPNAGFDIFFNQIVSLKYTLSGFKAKYPPSFLEIAMPYISLAIFTNWFTRIYGFRWREALTFYYVEGWRNVEHEIEGASQRIQEDCYRWARIIESLGLQFVRTIMTLIAFIPLLWTFSAKISIELLKPIAGSLVWVSLISSIGGLIVSWFVGWRLPGLEYNNQKVEAAFRKDLVLGEDDKKNYAQPDTLLSLFTGIKLNYYRLFLHYGYFDFWATGYSLFMNIVPLILMGPSVFSGAITLGVLFQVANAFDRVQSGFSIFLQNWVTITELRSIWKRLHEFEENINLYNVGSV